ncbi:MAG: family hydrolase [Phycisphaerales bacterium]|nr:family hydrolase [Phycisphaerales bacterium]
MLKVFHKARWIFFDVGYTLFDETPAWQGLFQTVSAELKRRGRDVPAEAIWRTYDDICATFAPFQWRGLCERLAASPAEAIELEKLSGSGWSHDGEVVYPGAIDTVRSLHGRYRLGVIANQHEGTVRRLAERNLGEYFDLVIGSAEAGVRKPDPAIFQMALAKAGCRADEAVMVGDRIDNDIRPANVIGMQTIHVRQGGSGRQWPRSAEETATVTVDTIGEVANLFGSRR